MMNQPYKNNQPAYPQQNFQPQTNEERELGWDDTIEKEGGDFTLLPAGVYPFRIAKMTRGRFAGSDKMPACPRAELEIMINSPEHGEVMVKENLLLHTKTEWKLSEFFTAIGQKKPGEKVTMNWQVVMGAQGMCELEVNHYTDNNGNKRENNRVKKYLEPEANIAPTSSYQAPPAQPNAYQAPAQGQPVQPFQPPFQAGAPQPPSQPGGFTPGSF